MYTYSCFLIFHIYIPADPPAPRHRGLDLDHDNMNGTEQIVIV